MLNLDLTVLSPGERWWLRRRRNGFTQEQMAQKLYISEKAYNMIETDRSRAKRRAPSGLWNPGDLCMLARRRSGMCLRTTAANFGISHTELLTRERESDPRLVEAWKSLKYRF